MNEQKVDAYDSYWPYQVVKIQNNLKIAFVTLILPGLPGKSGGEIRDGHILGYLSSRHEVDVYSINNFPLDDNRYNRIISQIRNLYYPEKNCIDYPHHVVGYKKQNLLDRLRSKCHNSGIHLPYGDYPYEVQGFMNTINAFTKNLLQKNLLKENYDLIIVTPQVNPLFLADINIPSSTKCIFATYDVEKVRYNRLKKTYNSILSRLTFQFEFMKAVKMERKIVSAVDGIIAVSDLDRDTYISEYKVDPSKVLTIENGVDSSYFFCNGNNKQSDTFNIVYVGNMGYPPNSQAVEFFINEVMPKVLIEVPKAVFWAVGANASPKILSLDNNSNIRVTGEVPDVRIYLEQADAVVIPLLTGSGTKYKVLEALSSGKPVITTSIGAEGIAVVDGEHLIIRNSPNDIAKATIECLSNKDNFKELASKGRQFVIKHHEWKVVLPKMEGWFENI